MMGRAQFEKGDFLEAAATFSYIARLYAAEPAVAAEANQWLARCYTQVKWYYDAEDALKRMRRDTIQRATLREADATQADLLLRQERFEEALPYLERAARYAKGSFRQARLYYLLGQVQHHWGSRSRLTNRCRSAYARVRHSNCRLMHASCKQRCWPTRRAWAKDDWQIAPYGPLGQ